MNADAHLRALSLLAEALRGSPLQLQITGFHPARAGLPPPARPKGNTPTATLPSGSTGFDSPEDWRRALRLSVLRACICAAGRAAVLPEDQSHLGWRAPPRDRRSLLERAIERLLQRAWVDARLRAHYSGARHDLDALLTLTLKRLGPPPSGALRGLLRALSMALLHHSLPDQAPSPSERKEAHQDSLLAALIQRSAVVLRHDATMADCSAAAADLHRLLTERFPGSRRSLRELRIRIQPLSTDPPVATANTWMPGARARPDEETLAAPQPPAKSPANSQANDAPSTGSVTDAQESQRPLAGSVGSTAAQAAGLPVDDQQAEDDPLEAESEARCFKDPVQLKSRYGPAAGEAVGVFLIDEWDCHGRRYLPAWCRLTELRLRGPQQDLLRDVRERHPDLARRILERFAALRPVSHRRIRGVPDGEDLDLDGVVRAMIERRAGASDDQRAWMRRERRERDVSTALLLDMSASTSLSLPAQSPTSQTGTGSGSDTGSSSNKGSGLQAQSGALLYGFYDDTPESAQEQPRRRVIDVARDSMALMALGLAALGDDHAIYGFSGSGRDNVEFHVARDFDDPWRQRSLGSALAAIEPRGSTRMGPAIRHAAMKLSRRPAPQRLLILVSDGYPQDIDYGPDRHDEGYGLQDTARALHEAERSGVATFCVTIDPGGHDYLRRMCTPDGYRVIEDVHALPEALSEIYARLTGRV